MLWIVSIALAAPPEVVVNQPRTLLEGESVILGPSDLAATDPDHDDNELTFEILGAPLAGVLRISGSTLGVGSSFPQTALGDVGLEYVHFGNEVVSDRFIFRVVDPVGEESADEIFSFTIEPVNDLPYVELNTGIRVTEGGLVVITGNHLCIRDEDHGSPELVFTLDEPPMFGELLVDGTGVAQGDTFDQQQVDDLLLVYDHDGGEAPSDFFVFTTRDPEGASIGDVFTLAVTGVDDPPEIADDHYETTMDQRLDVVDGVLANDHDPDGDALSAAVMAPPSGELDLREDGTFVYQPPAGFIGTDQFSYVGTAGEVSATGIVTIDVRDVALSDTADADSGVQDTDLFDGDTASQGGKGRTSDAGCGCTSTGSATFGYGWLALLWLRRRRWGER